MGDRILLLVGAGHAHLGVLDDIRRRGRPAARVILVEPCKAVAYSGMVPGWLAGEYRAREAMIPLAPLAAEAGVEWRRAALVALDPVARVCTLDTGETVDFDLCSIATGGAGRAACVLGDDPRLLDIRPIHHFMAHWCGLRNSPAPPRRIAVVGGERGGVELAFGLANAQLDPRPAIMLVAGAEGLLPAHSQRVRGAVRRELAAQGIAVVSRDAAFRDGVMTAGGVSQEPIDLVVAAVGSGAPGWPRAAGLPVDGDGFIRVDRHQRVCGHPHIFAAGDVARRTDRNLPHSGVHAVYAGPVLAGNLRDALSGRAPRGVYRGAGRDFYLLNTGRGTAIVSYGPLALNTRWLRRLKDWLDRRWITRFSR